MIIHFGKKLEHVMKPDSKLGLPSMRSQLIFRAIIEYEMIIREPFIKKLFITENFQPCLLNQSEMLIKILPKLRDRQLRDIFSYVDENLRGKKSFILQLLPYCRKIVNFR